MNNNSNQLELFNAFPDLAEKIPHISLGSFPTPVHRLDGFDDNVWIKRDDKTSDEYGGNKVRKLEFILAQAVSENKTHIVTVGGLGTNHGLATTIYCHRLNLKTSLILFDQPVNEYVKRNLLLFHKYGAELIYAKTMFRLGLRYYLFDRLKNPKAYFVYAGGSSEIGALGFVNAAFELKKQIESGSLPEPGRIFCPLGSNGTMAGLILGLKLAGLDIPVIGVRVTLDRFGPIPIACESTVKSLMEKTYRYLRSCAKSIPEIEITMPFVLHDYFGEGYGFETQKGRDALEAMRSSGINLEPTYTAKTFAAVLDNLKENSKTSGPTLYWHTYNSSDLNERVESVDYREMPDEFHRFFE